MAWSNQQKGIVQMYRRYAGMADAEYRAVLHQETGAWSSTHRALSQYDFDVLMPILEVRAHLAETNGCAIGRRPPKLSDWYHWRRRCPKRGKINTRLLWRIDKLWAQLEPLLPQEHRGPDRYGHPRPYLYEMASHATGRYIEHLHDLTLGEACSLVEAIKDRLTHAIKSRGAA